MSRSFALSALLALAAPALGAQTAPALLAEAQAAARPDRAVLVLFHASWCSWCRRLEGTLARPAVKAILDRHFVPLWLTVQERGPNQKLDTPGAARLYQDWTGGAKAGLPFYLVLDPKGSPRSTSIRPQGGRPENIGYPGSPEEIQGFLSMLKEGAPGLTAAELETLRRELDAAKPKA